MNCMRCKKETNLLFNSYCRDCYLFNKTQEGFVVVEDKPKEEVAVITEEPEVTEPITEEREYTDEELKEIFEAPPSKIIHYVPVEEALNECKKWKLTDDEAEELLK